MHEVLVNCLVELAQETFSTTKKMDIESVQTV